jgi:hypothetical protein
MKPETGNADVLRCAIALCNVRVAGVRGHVGAKSGCHSGGHAVLYREAEGVSPKAGWDGAASSGFGNARLPCGGFGD